MGHFLELSGADFSLTIDGVEYPLFLLEENGVKQWNDGLAPMFTPQFRTSEFSYSHVPPEIEVVEAFEGFPHGAGFDTQALGETGGYNYSRNVDASWGSRIILSPHLTDLGIVLGTGQKIYASSLGVFITSGPYIYKVTLSGVTPSCAIVGDFSADGITFTDIVELDGVLYAGRGDNMDYVYSTDGTTWTVFTDANENATAFSVRGNASDIAALWKVQSNIIKTTTDVRNGGVAWAGSDEVGHSSESVQSAITVDNDIYVFKKEGFYRYDGVNTQDVWKTQYRDSRNGVGAYLWSNGKIYVPYGSRLLEYDPYGDTALEAVYPPAGFDSLELVGDITAIGGSETHLYVSITNRDNNCYVLKGNRDSNGTWVWHSILFSDDGGGDPLRVTALLVVGPGVIHPTNPGIIFTKHTGLVRFIVLPRANVHPTEDASCTFGPTGSYIVPSLVGPYTAFGAKTFEKFLNRGSALGSRLSATQTIQLQYEKDRDGVETSLLMLTTDGIAEAPTVGDVAFFRIRPHIYLSSSSALATPILEAVALGATLNPGRKRIWRPVIVLNEHQHFREGGGTDSLPSINATRNALFGAASKRVTMTDRHTDATYTVRLLDIQPGSLQEKDQGKEARDLGVYQLSIVEIQPLTPHTSDAAIYGTTHYGDGSSYG